MTAPTPAPAPAPGPTPAPASAPTGSSAPEASVPDNNVEPAATQPPVQTPVLPDATADGLLKTTVDSADPDASRVEGRAGRQRQRSIENARFKVAGDMVGGDKLVFALGDAEPAPLQALATWMSEPVRHAFVAPDGWDAVRVAASDRRVIVLRAGPGHGKVAAAIKLLQSPPDRRIFNLDRNVDLRRLGHWLDSDAKSENPLPRAAGFLLCEPLAWDQISAWVLQQLETRLEAIDARLMLTVTADTPLGDPDLTTYIVTLPPPRPQTAVLAAHLAWSLNQPQAAAERLLAEPELAEFAERVFTADQSMKVAADLAVMIGQELDGATVDLTRLKRRWAERATEDFEIWFGGLPDVQTRCLAIALAVLNGLPYEVVVYAAGRLAEILDGPQDGADGNNPRPPWRDPFSATRGELLRLLRARIRTTTVRGPFGSTPAEVMEYVGEDYASAILTRVWREYRIQVPLLRWLCGLADNPSEDVRIWTATALGVFAKQAFDFVHRNAMATMGVDKKFWLRDVAANALSVPAGNVRMRPLVESVVAGWYGNDNNRLGQATAARVWGTALGVHDPDRALNALERLTTIDDRRVAQGIADSLADLLLADEAGNAMRVLRRAGSWLFDDRRALSGTFVFLALAENLTMEPVGGGGTWPMLLFLADQRTELRDKLLAMWHRVIRSGLLADATARVLARWADLAEADAGVRTALANMLAALPGAVGRFDAVELNLRAQLSQWLAPDNLQPKTLTAYAVEAELAKRNGS
ncbi:hypothetical protein [Micromonospora saelicesensis]|uniref:hypothetical protein n=1 Tax=Micromonospora saelicesensis TaxID=285676 RepID=UPI000DC521B9|nr:hypothetical protein [Micromonospora saelicesensis]RAO50852.1 hypothetical protein PSN01_04416 [Micromonospora saelicesensis]